MNDEIKAYSEEEITKLRIDVQHLVETNPDVFSILLKKQENKYLLEFVKWYTYPYLDNEFYTMGTRCYWVINGIRDWNNKKVCCQNCGKPFKHRNVAFTRGYRQCCSTKCSNEYKRKMSQHYDPSKIDEYRKELIDLYENANSGHEISQQLINKSYLMKIADDFAPDCIKNHSEQTKRYWFMHNIKEFPRCAICNSEITRNVINPKLGYTTRTDESRDQLYCSGECAKKSEHYIREQQVRILERFGEIKTGHKATIQLHMSFKDKRRIKYREIIAQNFVVPTMSEDEFAEFKVVKSLKANQKIEWICCRCGNHFYSKYQKCNGYILKNLGIKANARCPKCFPRCNTSSLEERKLAKWVSKLSDDLEVIHSKHYNWHVIYPYELDILVYNKKLQQKFAIEYDGVHWHSIQLKGDRNIQLMKTSMCEQLGIPLIHIYEDEWLYGRNKIKHFLKRYLLNGFTYTKRIPNQQAIFELPHDKFPSSTIVPGWKLVDITEAKKIKRSNQQSKDQYLVYDCGNLVFERQMSSEP